MTRFVRIANNVDLLNLAQVLVYTQDGTNVALRKSASCDVGPWPGLPQSNLVDGVGTNQMTNQAINESPRLNLSSPSKYATG